MIRVNNTRPRNDVHAKHILKLFPKNATEEQKAVCKRQIDSVYAVLKTGANFEEMAKAESQDGSTNNGGELGWFGRGRMVQPFEDIAFDLADGEFSEPFETRFGYHIIKKVAHGVAPLSEVRSNIEAAISRDERAGMIKERRLSDLKNKYGFKLNPDFDKYVTRKLAENGGNYDSTFVAQSIKGSDMPLFTYGTGKSVRVADLLPQLNSKAKFVSADDAKKYILSSIDPLADKVLADFHAHELVQSNPDYRNLLNEYRDGMLLFEISNRRVWKAANKDTVGLENYFAEHRANYAWDEPHFKGIILSAKNDSVLNLVKNDIMMMAADTLTDGLHHKYGNDIRMERMVVKKGENALADYLAFNTGDKPERKGYESFMILEGGVIRQPEEMADVRGAVTSDYQDVLEQRWKEELATKYPAKINKKVLKQVK
jgi:peptidyl-prolyl cis-trans isomerase SurA